MSYKGEFGAFNVLTSASIPIDSGMPAVEWRRRFETLLVDREALRRSTSGLGLWVQSGRESTSVGGQRLTGQPFGPLQVTGYVPVETCRMRRNGERPVLYRPTVVCHKVAGSMPDSTAWAWMVGIALKKLRSGRKTHSTELELYRLNSRGLRLFDSIQRRLRPIDPSRVFMVDSVGTAELAKNYRWERVSTRAPSKNRSETWCPDLERFEPVQADLFVDRTIDHELDGSGNPRPVPHGLPWEVFSDWDYGEIRRRARIMSNVRDLRSTYRTAENVWEDVAQDASIRFAAMLQQSASWDAIYWSAEGWPVAFWYVPKARDEAVSDVFEADAAIVGVGGAGTVDPGHGATEAETDIPTTSGFMVTRSTLHSWSVKAALKRYNLDKTPEITLLPGQSAEDVTDDENSARRWSDAIFWHKTPQSRPEYLNTSLKRTTATDPVQEFIWAMVWQNGENYPILRYVMTEHAIRPGSTKAHLWVNATQITMNRDKTTAKDRNVVKSRGSDEWSQLQTDLIEQRDRFSSRHESADMG